MTTCAVPVIAALSVSALARPMLRAPRRTSATYREPVCRRLVFAARPCRWTEPRVRVACAFLASASLARTRESLMPAPMPLTRWTLMTPPTRSRRRMRPRLMREVATAQRGVSVGTERQAGPAGWLRAPCCSRSCGAAEERGVSVDKVQWVVFRAQRLASADSCASPSACEFCRLDAL